MKPIATDKKVSPSSPNLTQIIRKILIVYLISAVTVLAICFIFGWRSLQNIGNGFMYGFLGLALFGALILAEIRCRLNFHSLNTLSPLLVAIKKPEVMVLHLEMREKDSFLRLFNAEHFYF